MQNVYRFKHNAPQLITKCREVDLNPHSQVRSVDTWWYKPSAPRMCRETF